MESLRQQFRPEFLNRVDEIILFHALTRQQLSSIVDIQLRSLQRWLQQRDITIEITTEAREALANEGFDPVYGAAAQADDTAAGPGPARAPSPAGRV